MEIFSLNGLEKYQAYPIVHSVYNTLSLFLLIFISFYYTQQSILTEQKPSKLLIYNLKELKTLQQKLQDKLICQS